MLRLQFIICYYIIMSYILNKLVGLSNIGNTCYMNSTLQALFGSNIFNNVLFLYLKKYPNCIDNMSYMLKAYISLVIEISRTNNSFYNPAEFKTILGKENDLFFGFQQQDAHELLVYLVNDFCDDKKSKKISQLIKKLCFGKYKQYVYCKSCRNTSITYTEFFDINLQIPNKSNITLKDCFEEEFLKIDRLDDDNKYFCNTCQTKTVANKKIEIESVPDVLFISLKRFTNNNKISTPVKICHNINLENKKLELVSTINHYGGCGGGHYTANVKKNGSWYNANDSSINNINFSLEDPSIYVMVYQFCD